MNAEVKKFQNELKKLKASDLGQTQITMYNSVTQTKNPNHIPLWFMFGRLKGGMKTKPLIESIRQHPNDKERRNELKQKLPCIIIGGTFITRNIKGLKEHSGLMAVDFDGYDGDPKKSLDYKKLKECPEVFCIFESPSGNGFKGIVRIPKCSAMDHTKYFKAFQHYNQFDNWDKSTSDVSRVCYESYDAEPYLNIHASVFDPDLSTVPMEIEDDKKTIATNHTTLKPVHSSTLPIFALDDDDKIIDLVMRRKAPYSFIKGERHNYVLHLSNVMCSKGVSEKGAADYINLNINCGEVANHKIEKIVRDAYEKKYFPYEPYEDYEKKNEYKAKIKEDRNAIIESGELDTETISKLIAELEKEFWYKNEKEQLKIDNKKYITFLHNHGYKKYYPENDGKIKFVKAINGKVSKVSTTQIKDFVLNYLDSNNYTNVWSYVTSYANLFSVQFLDALNTIKITETEDTATSVLIPFENEMCVLLSDQSEKLISYKDIKDYTWESSVLKRKLVRTDNDENPFKEFINKVSEGDPLSFETTFGYLISRYNNARTSKAVILSDENFTTGALGGTGKGLFMSGVKEIRKMWIIDGKDHDNKDRFAYSGVEKDTNIVFVDDPKPNFDFKNLFSKLTTGLSTQKKGQDKVKLDLKKSPKFVIATNHTIKGTDYSDIRRQHNLVFSQFFGSNRDLGDYFGHELFYDWDEDQFNRFNNYAINCVKKFLKHGLVEQKNPRNLELRKFVADTSTEFYEWINDDNFIIRGVEVSKDEAFNDFTQSYKDFNKWLTRRRFTEWIQKYAKYKGLEYDAGKSSITGRWFSLSEPKQYRKGGAKVIDIIKSRANAKKNESDEDNDIFEDLFKSNQG